VSTVVAPVLGKLLQSHRDREVQKGIAQLKLAFDNCEKVCPGLSAEVLTRIFAVASQSSNVAARSLAHGGGGGSNGS